MGGRYGKNGKYLGPKVKEITTPASVEWLGDRKGWAGTLVEEYRSMGPEAWETWKMADEVKFFKR